MITEKMISFVCLCLSVCLSRTSGLSREQRGRGRPKLAQRWLGHHFQGQGHRAALFSAALTRKAAAAVSVGMYSAWKRMLRCVCSAAREAFGCVRGRRGNVMKKKNKNLFPVAKYNINTQNTYKHQIFITAYRRLPESFYKLSMLTTYNTFLNV